MEILYYDCFAGISGDMNLAAMLELGVPSSHLISELKKLNIGGYELDITSSMKMGISGTRVNVKLIEEDSHNDNKHHSHRTYKHIKKIIEDSTLTDEVKKTGIKIFEKVAIAEAKIHNKNIDDIHFHEVGAVDSIIDIVGAAICYHYLNPKQILCSTVELGSGFVQCAHGNFPVPAPATAEILKDIPVKLGTVQVEATTPTGAAILATLVDQFTDKPLLKIQKTAYGVGHRDMDIPNVLRVHNCGSYKSSNNYEQAIMMECNIDDMPSEQFDYLIDRLLEKGAMDVFLTPVIMKKSRPATKVSVLCSKYNLEVLQDILFRESTTLGIRSYNVEKSMLTREIKTITTKYGEIDVKLAFYNDEILKSKAEYEQCKKAAIKHKVPLTTVMDEVHNELKKSY